MRAVRCLQVEQLESQLLKINEQKDEAVKKDLLMYIKSMPEHQLQVSCPTSALASAGCFFVDSALGLK